MPLHKDNGQRYLYYDDTYGVSLIDVAICLRDFRKDKDGNYNLSLLCTSPNINLWAKFKPVRYNFITEEERAAIGDWWKAQDGMCGFDLEDAEIETDLSDIESKYTMTHNGWKHAAPRGGDAEPFRLADFVGNTKNVGYNHLADSFVKGFVIPSTWAQDDTDNFEVAFRITEPGNADADYLSYKDLALENYYLGAAFVKNGEVVLKVINENVISTPDSVGQSGFRMEIDPKSLPVGSYMLYPFIANANDKPIIPTRMLTIPDVKAETIEIVSEMLTVRIEGIIRVTRWVYTVTITNNSQKVAEIEDLELRLRSGQASSFNDPISDGYVYDRVEDTIVINPNETVVALSGDKATTDALRNSNPKQWLYFYHVGQKGKEYSVNIEQEILPDA